MVDKDALKDFDWNTVTGSGLYLKVEEGKPAVIRVLTTDPVVTTQEFEGADGEINLSTKFSFVVFNFTEQRAQIYSATPGMARKIGELHVDEDFGADIKKIDLKLSATGSGQKKRYDIQVLQKTNELTVEQIKECAAIKLDEKVKDGTRMSLYDPAKFKKPATEEQTLDEVAEVPDNDEPINLDDIPF